MKKLLLILYALLSVSVAHAFDAHVNIDGIYYNLYDDSSATVVSNNYSYYGDIIIPETVSYNGTTYSVTSIGRAAFEECTGLTSITIPNSVTSIDEFAFYGCSGLTTITIPNSVTSIGEYAFYNCTGLTSVVIGNSVTSIGRGAFLCCGLTKLVYNAEKCSGGGFVSPNYHWLDRCSKLKEVEIGTSVKTIPAYAFDDCKSIESVNIPSIEAWTSIEFGNETANPTYYAKKLLVNGESIRRLTLPPDLTQLNSYAFINCEPLVTVTCGSEILSAGKNVFSGCTGLQRISFSELSDFLQINYSDEKCLLTYNNDAAIYIGDNPLDFTNIKWPKNLTEIPDYAFYNRSDLKGIEIPETVVSIGKYAFANSGITQADLPTGLERLGEGAFSYTSITTVEIPQTVSEIPQYAFQSCKSLKSVSFSEGLQSIGHYAFRSCSSLPSISFPAGLQSIGSSAFWGCSSLTSVSFPAGLQSIGGYAFWGCSSLRSVEIADINGWANVNFGDDYSNPIFFAHTFKQKDMDGPIRHLDLKYVDHISAFAFCNASNLQTIRVNGATIGKNAFYSCNGVTDLCIDTDNIDSGAFSRMVALKNIYSLTDTPPTASDDVFSNYTGINLYVPQGAVSAYENADNCWWRFLDVYESNFAGLDAIFAPDYDGIADVDCDLDYKVYSDNGCVYVETQNDADYVAIVNLQGLTVHQGRGNVAKEVSPGIYIVIVNNKTTKIYVK